LAANPFLCELVGIPLGEMIGKTVGESWPSKKAAAFQALLEDLPLNGSLRFEDMELDAKDGERRPVEILCNAFQTGDEMLIGCGVRDVTERRKTEDQLRLLQTCVAHLNDILMITEADPIDEPGPKIVFANEAVERITGYTPAELIGKTPRILQGKDTDRNVLKEIRHALENRQPIRRHLINYGKDGSQYWIGVNLVPIFSPDGECTHFAAIERDITELTVKEMRIRRLADSNAQAVLFWNARGTVTDANNTFLRLSGYSREELSSGVVTWPGLVPEKRADDWRRAHAELTEKGSVSPYEIEIVRKDGTPVPVLFGAARIDDKLQDGVGFILDLTERTKLEQQVLNAKRMESLGTLAGGMAHHLNNILSPIVMSVGLLRTTATRPDERSLLDVIDKSANRAAAIVRQVLSFALGVEGAKVDVRPRDLLRSIEARIRDTFPKNLSLATHVPADAWTFSGDPAQLHEALMNLCLNARDAMPDGGALSINVENVVVDQQLRRRHGQVGTGPYVAISVADTGTGIPPEIIDRIFEPFFTTKEVGRGNGLGLSIVSAVVRGHGGFVEVLSEVGKGSTFKVFLMAGNRGFSSETPNQSGAAART
jgi:PAS domain S-box-containing protein